MEIELAFFIRMAFLASCIAFAYAIYLCAWVKKIKVENQKIISVGKLIKAGADTFMRKEYRVLAVFTLVAAFIIFLLLPAPLNRSDIWSNLTMALSYVAGTVFSAIAGKIGIYISTIANTRTAQAAQKSMGSAFTVGFRGGSVMGLSVVGASLLGVASILALTGSTTALLGFSFGASSLALFAKAGGGIFTKTADISADLVGKVELGIPEDDPRNPAVIADNVGDNVGDVAGMGADLFDSNVAAMAAALVMASNLDGGNGINIATVFCYVTLGLISSIIGIMTAGLGKKGTPTGALNRSTYITTGVFILLTAAVTAIVEDFRWEIWGASATGLFVGVIIGMATDYFTNDAHSIVRKVAKSSTSGPAFTILNGVSYGFVSSLPAMIGIAVSALAAYKLCDGLGDGYAMFGISMAAVGMLSIVGMIVSNDAYGPIVDNARGLAEMGNLGEAALKNADELDSAGNTVKAITKGFAISAAGLTVISLLGAYMSELNVKAEELGFDRIEIFSLTDPTVFFGMLIGAAVPAVFSAMLMLGVVKNAGRMVAEIHRQFREIVGLKEGRSGVLPDYASCINIAAGGALGELVSAGLFAIAITLGVGFVGGVYAIAGFLVGNIVSGLLLALFMSNSGGLWDNAKKYIESGAEGGKGSDAHKAAVIGDTVGDPFKDTAGPSINTQITVVSLISSLFSGLFLTFSIF